MKQLTLSIITLGLLLAFQPAHAQENQTLSLEQAVQSAFQNRRKLKTYTLDRDLLDAAARELKTQRLPVLSARAELQYNPIIATSVLPASLFNPNAAEGELAAIRFGTFWNSTAGIDLTQSIIQPGLNGQVREQELRKGLVAADELAAREDIALNVSRAYYEWLLSEAELVYAQEDSSRSAALLIEVQDRQAAGRAGESEVRQAQLSVRQASLRCQQARQLISQRQGALRYQMGQEPAAGASWQATDQLESLFKSIQMEETGPAAGNIESRRSEFRRLAVNEDIYLLQEHTERQLLLPVLSVGGFLGLNHFSDNLSVFNSNNWFGNSSINLRLSLPLTRKWIMDRRLEQIQVQERQNRLQQDLLRDQLQFEQQQALETRRQALQRLAIRQVDLELAENHLQEARDRYSAGRGLLSAVSDADLSLKRVRYDYLLDLYQLLLSDLELKRVRGVVVGE